MTILSLQNPMTYIIVVLLIGVAYILYRVATKKVVNVELGGCTENEIENTSLQPTHTQTPFTKNQKYCAPANCKKIIPNFFSNGSCLVINKNGGYIRKKKKYCIC